MAVTNFEQNLLKRGYVDLSQPWMPPNRSYYERRGIFGDTTTAVTNRRPANMFFVYYREEPSHFRQRFLMGKTRIYGGLFDGETGEPFNEDAHTIKKHLKLT